MTEKMRIKHLEELMGKEIGVSEWFKIDQDRINAFAECTEDRQWIHVDVEKARRGPLKATVAHGFLVLALLPYLNRDLDILKAKFRMAVNYGLNRVRFIQPVKSGACVRCRAVLKDVSKKGFRRILVTFENTIEIEGEDKPALVAETLAMFFV